jgi:hypothetical protein
MSIPVQPLNIHVGRGDIWIGVSVPAQGSTVALNADGQPADGRMVGATLAGANWIYNPNPYKIRTQQSTMISGFVTIDEEVKIEFTVGEITYQNIKDMFSSPKDQTTFVSVGGLIVPVIQSCLIVAPRRGGGFIEAMVYQAAFYGERNMAFQREAHMPVRVIAEGQADFTRALGDQGGFFAPAVFPTL